MSYAQQCNRGHCIAWGQWPPYPVLDQSLSRSVSACLLVQLSKQPPELTLCCLLRSLDREDFKLFVERLTQEMGKPFSIVSELLILSALEVQPLEKSDSAILQEIQVSKRHTPGS